MRISSIASLAGMMLLWFAMGTFSAAVQAQGTGSSASSSAAAGNAVNGKKLYNDIGCWQCHGYSGQGGAGPKLAPGPISLAGFTRYIRKPTAAMPPYTAKVVSDAQLADIYAFLLTIPKSPDPKSIPLLNKTD